LARLSIIIRNVFSSRFNNKGNTNRSRAASQEVGEQPTGEEVREVLRLAGLSGGKAAQALGLGEKGGRTVRRWISEDSGISYANWALLCEMARLGLIWKED
ncbi:hypothetical protein, partial [Xylella fastidiosa]|uniref:hypothetical protein n=1 Tax=Xylella fastidiosa TaxID=2371 RepID=UPI002ED86699